MFRAVLALAADKSRASVDYAVSLKSSQEVGATREEYNLLCEVDELSDKLECVLHELATRAAGHERSAVGLFARRVVKDQLLEALNQCGRNLSGIDVTECIQPAKRPLDGRPVRPRLPR